MPDNKKAQVHYLVLSRFFPYSFNGARDQYQAIYDRNCKRHPKREDRIYAIYSKDLATGEELPIWFPPGEEQI